MLRRPVDQLADLFKELTLNSLLLTYGQWQVRLQFIWGVCLICVMMGMTCTQQEWHEPIQGNWIACKEDAPKKRVQEKKSWAFIWNIPLVNFKRLEHVLRKSGLAFKKTGSIYSLRGKPQEAKGCWLRFTLNSLIFQIWSSKSDSDPANYLNHDKS